MAWSSLKPLTVLFFLVIPVFIGCGQPEVVIQPPEQRYIWADSVLNTLNLESKIGQMIMVDVASVGNITSERDREDFLSTMMQGRVGGFVLFAGQPLEFAPWIEWAHVTSEVPPFVALDAEWGAGFRLKGFTRFPNAMSIAASGNTDLAFQIGQTTAKQANSIGVNVLFAPVADVQTNPLNPVIGTRAWSDHPDSVAAYAGAFAKGVRRAGLLPVAKHFPGHGDTSKDSHTDLPVSNRTEGEFFEEDLLPFNALISDSLEAIMSAHIVTKGHSFSDTLPSTLSKRVLSELLRDSLNFEGLVFSDALNMAGVRSQGSPSDVAIGAIQAGIDVLLMPPDAPQTLTDIVAAVRRGDISEARIDSSVRRILRAKERLGLNQVAPRADLSEALNLITSERTQDEAWFAARKSVTLIKNSDTIPLSTSNRPISLLTLDFRKYEDPLSSPANRLFKALLDRSKSPVELIQIDPYNSASSLARSLGSLESNSTLIFADFIGVTPVAGWNRQLFLENLTTLGRSLVIFDMASPFAVPRTPKEAQSHILGYDSSDGMIRATTDVLFGISAARGRLPVHINDELPRGFGLTSEQVLPARVPPSEANMDDISLAPLDRVLQNAVDDHAFPAAALVVGRGNSIVKRADFGRFTYDTNRLLNESDVFDLASLTKVIATTTAIMQLVESDLIDLHRPVADYLPEFAENGKGAVTIWDLLTHTGGLIPFRPFYAQGVSTAAQIRSSILGDSLVYEPGTQSSYSDFGPITLAWMVERITGESFDEYTKNNVFTPLSMFETEYKKVRQGSIPNAVPTEADSYFRYRLLQGEVHDETAYVLGGTAGHAGLFSTANDLSKFASMLANKGRVGNTQFLKPETIRQFTTRIDPFGDHTRALGWDTKSAHGYSSAGSHFGPLSFGHTGFTGTSFWVDPDTGLFVILLTNRVYPTRANRGHIPIRPRVADIAFSAIRTISENPSPTE